MVVFLEQRAVQADHVGFAEQGIQIDVLGAQIQGGLVLIRVTDQQAHAEPLEDAQGGDADLTGADDAGGAAEHVEADQAIEGEVGIPRPLIGLMDAAVQRHHQADGVLGHRFGGVGGHADHADPEILGGLQVDVVVTGAAHGQHSGAVCG